MIAALEKKGYNKLVIQVGPSLRYGETSEQRGGVSIEMWKLKASLQPDFESADLVISHAGSGCVLDALRLQKALIVVPNPSLLHGHQAELASALENRNYLRTSTLSNLPSTITEFDGISLAPFPKFEGTRFRTILDEEMGYEP